MSRRVLRVFAYVTLLLFLDSSSAFALRLVPIDDERVALSNSIKRSYRARRTAKGLSYRRRGRLPRGMRASRAAGETFPVVFRNADDRIQLRQRLIYRIVIDGKQVDREPAYVDGHTPAFHVANLPVGRHSVKLTVGARATSRRYTVYWGHVLVSGGERLSITLHRCRVPARCRATLREGGRGLFGRP